MHILDQEHTFFITDHGLYCYKIMSFGLKNTRATYQCLFNMMFKEQIGRTMEVYVDDMLIKSKTAADHVVHLSETFVVLRRYRIKLNLLKYAFWVASGKFLGFMVNHWGIEANLEKIQALIDMQSPSKMKEIQSLTRRVVAFSRFISRATDKCLPFFDSLTGSKRFLWDDKREHAFRSLKEYLSKPSLLSKPIKREPLYLYLAVMKYAILGALVREDNKVQWPVYYISKRLVDAETRYPEMEKLALALMIGTRKLRPYFYSHPVRILTNYPLRQVLPKLDALGRLLKWAIELSQFEIEFQPWPAIKGQALADFITEFSHKPWWTTRRGLKLFNTPGSKIGVARGWIIERWMIRSRFNTHQSWGAPDALCPQVRIQDLQQRRGVRSIDSMIGTCWGNEGQIVRNI